MFGSERAFKAMNEVIKADPLYELAMKGKLSLTELGGEMALREESRMASWAEKIPLVGRGIRASGRAYTGMANKLRFDVFKSLVKSAKVVGRSPETEAKLLKDITGLVNNGTGRGSLGFFEKYAVELNASLFSPRLIASRLTLLNPFYYAKLDPFVRKEALKSLFAFAGMIGTTLGLAKMAGAEVGTDSNSADYLKIKIGNTRIDLMGGFQQYIVAASRLISGKYVSSTTGKELTLGEGYKPLTRIDIASRLAEAKTAPILSFILDLARGQNYMGQPLQVFPHDITMEEMMKSEVGSRFVPMVIGDIYDIAQTDPDLLPAGFLGVFGVGLQTYISNKPTLKYGGGGGTSLKGLSGFSK